MEEEEIKYLQSPPMRQLWFLLGHLLPQRFFRHPNRSEAKKTYTENVGTQIAQAISYPYEAKEYGWAQHRGLNITILNDGNVKDVSIKASSGHAVFDKDAVNTAKILLRTTRCRRTGIQKISIQRSRRLQ